LLDLLPHEPPAATVDDRWGIIAIDSDCRTSAASCDDETTPVAAAFGILLAALRRSCRDDPERLGQLILPVASLQSRLPREFESLAIGERFQIPPEICGATAVFSAAGLLPASVMGLDIVRLLQGASAMKERFRSAPIGDNPPLDFAGILELSRRRGHGIARPRFFASNRGAAAVAEWCQALSQSEDSRSQISDFESQTSNLKIQILDSDMDHLGLTVNLIVGSVRRDRIAVEPVAANATSLSEVGKTLPELNADAIDSAKAASAPAGRPTVDIKLPALDELSLGQLFQMLIIASVLEARLAT
jgi:glucose-6-phosphate isomerase